MNRHIWNLVFASEGANVLPGKWVLDQKHENDGTWIRNRARWVMCGNFEGTEGWSAQDLYAAVASAIAVKIFFTLIAIYGIISTQADIITAFLNIVIPEEIHIYVRQPIGFTNRTAKICRFNKAFYGLRRSLIWWYGTLTPYLKLLGFKPMLADQCLFQHREKGIFLLLYVNDFRVAAFIQTDINWALAELNNGFELKVLGEDAFFLGFEIRQNLETHQIWLGQPFYAQKLIEKFGYKGINPATTPWRAKMQISLKWDSVPEATKKYQQHTGSINYLATGTRPNIV
jgi:hypothetical protein